MNFILHKHQTNNHVVPLPKGLKELLADITREVLRAQPPNIYEYIANYLEAVLITREDTAVAERTVASLIDCSMTIADLISSTGITREKAEDAAKIIQRAFRQHKADNQGLTSDQIIPLDEKQILIDLIELCNFDENELYAIQDILNTAYKSFYYREINFIKNIRRLPGVFWKDAVENTLNIYRKSIPDIPELQRSAVVIQSAYRGYYTRKMLIDDQNIEPYVIKIQAYYRGYRARVYVKHLRHEDKIVTIQSAYRGHQARKKIKAEREAAAHKHKDHLENVRNVIKIQALFRGFLIRRDQNAAKQKIADRNEHHLKHENKIVQIQSAYRGYRIRKSIDKGHKAASKIQAHYRHHLSKRNREN